MDAVVGYSEKGRNVATERECYYRPLGILISPQPPSLPLHRPSSLYSYPDFKCFLSPFLPVPVRTVRRRERTPYPIGLIFYSRAESPHTAIECLL